MTSLLGTGRAEWFPGGRGEGQLGMGWERERPTLVLTIIVVSLQMINHEWDGVLGLVDQELLQHVLWAQGRHSGG